jgi:hypothetical protein
VVTWQPLARMEPLHRFEMASPERNQTLGMHYPGILSLMFGGSLIDGAEESSRSCVRWRGYWRRSQRDGDTIKGQALGTFGGTDSFRFMAEKIGSFKVNGTAFPLNKTGPDNVLVGVTGDLRIFDNA